MAKRGQGEGSIYKRKDGRWAAVINLGYRDGKLQRASFYGKTRVDAARKLTTALNNRQKDLPVQFGRQTLAQFLDRWLEDCAKPTIRPKTYESYAHLIRKHIKPVLGHVQLTKLEPAHVQRLMNEKMADGLSARTVQYLRAVLRRALGQGLKWGLVARNVATLVDPPRYQRPKVQPLSPDEVQALLDAIKGERLEALFLVTVALGLRQGEVLGLRWRDVDVTAGILRVNFSLQRVNGALQLVEPKTERSRRTLSMPGIVLTALRSHHMRQLEEQLLACESWQESGLVFTTSKGTPLDARNVIRKFHAMVETAGLPRYRFHDLRHSCASLLLAQHVPARVVMDVLGHSQISLTLDTYSHVMPEALKEAAEKMEAVLSGRK